MRFCLATVLLATITSSLPAQDARSGLADNAALWYWRAFMTIEQYDDRVDEAINAAMMSEGEDADASGDVRMFTTIALPDLRRAAASPSCTFAVDWDAGFMAMLPHITYLNEAFKLLEADATCALAAGDDEVAAERIMLMLAMAGHTAQEPAVLSCFLATRFIDTCAGLQRRMAVDELGGDTVARLGALWSLVENIGPEHLASTYLIHQQRTREGSRRRWSGEDGAENLREDFRMLVDINSRQSPQPGDYETLDEQFEQWKTVDEAIAGAIRDRDEAQLARIAQELGDGEYGWLARGLTSNFRRPYDAMIEAEVTVRAMKQMLDAPRQDE